MDRRESPKLRWGILGTGGIARQFARDLPFSSRGELTGVASRSLSKSEEFIESLVCPESISHRPKAFGTYLNLLGDSEIDAVYIALPNVLHHEWTKAALQSGKHVLCEKPLALSVTEAEDLFAVADANGRLLMEAFMYRAHPQTRLLLDMVKSGTIGDLRVLQMDFCFNREASSADARYQANAGGGALMDVGCYCIDLARSLTGEEPVSMRGLQHLHEFQVDDYFAGSLLFPGGTLASFVCGMTVSTDQTSRIYGTGGWIEVPRFWKAQEGFVLHRPGVLPEAIVVPDSHGLPPLYALEADAFVAVIRGGENWNPPENTLSNLAVIESLRVREEP